MIFRSWLARKFPPAVARDGNRWRPVASRWGPHRKPLKLRGFDLKVRFDCCISRLLGAHGWLRLSAIGWLRLSWPHLNSGGRFACWFRKVGGWLRCFVWGLTRSSSGGVEGLVLLLRISIHAPAWHVLKGMMLTEATGAPMGPDTESRDLLGS